MVGRERGRERKKSSRIGEGRREGEQNLSEEKGEGNEGRGRGQGEEGRRKASIKTNINSLC